MGALPKRKSSKARQGKRRSNYSINSPRIVDCPQCHNPKLPHHVCPTCGTYAGREIIETEGPKKKSG